MRIEGGSQNVSRVPGHYAYVAPSYNPGPVEPVERIRARMSQASAPAQGMSGPGGLDLMRDPIYEITHSTRAAKYLGAKGLFVDRLA
jgi:hypothetical protein